VLARWSGQRDLVIGIPLAGRTEPGADKLIGLLVNMLPIRVDVGGEPTFAALLGRVRQASVDGYAHADAPLDVLVKELDIPRDPRHTPLFQTVLNVVGTAPEPQLAGLTVQTVDAAAQPSKFDLSFNVMEAEGQTFVQLDYKRYDPPVAKALVAQLMTLLRAALHDPDLGVLDYRLDDAPDEIPESSEPFASNITADDRVAVLTSNPALAATATATHTAPPFNTTDITTWLRDNAITVVFLSPPQLRALTGPLPELRQAYIDNDGDLTAHDITTLRQIAPNCHITTVYIGPDQKPAATWTRTDTWNPTHTPLRIPIGTPLPGHHTTLRHPGGQPASTGESAELHINNHPTGHRARRHPDGTLEHHGPIHTRPADDPIHTITTLRDHPQIADAVVVGDTAYVAAAGVSSPAIRSYLLTRLPDRLVPQRVHVLEAIPRTADGGYDLTAVAEPDDDGWETEYVAPRTPLEHWLTEVFQELLGVERIGVHDSFFELNGFSLLATQMTARVRAEFDVELPLREVFNAPTVEGLAQMILWKQSERSDADELEALLAAIEAEA
jgi:acyl carrier protein